MALVLLFFKSISYPRFGLIKNVLITAAGFIGSNLALKLIEKGYQVIGLDNLSPEIHGENLTETSPLYLNIKDKVKFIRGTVTSKADW